MATDPRPSAATRLPSVIDGKTMVMVTRMPTIQTATLASVCVRLMSEGRSPAFDAAFLARLLTNFARIANRIRTMIAMTSVGSAATRPRAISVSCSVSVPTMLSCSPTAPMTLSPGAGAASALGGVAVSCIALCSLCLAVLAGTPPPRAGSPS